MMGQFIVVDPSSELVTVTPNANNMTLRWSENLNAPLFNLQSSGLITSPFTNVNATPTLMNNPINSPGRFTAISASSG